jgi:hypothetical protein
VDFTIITSGYFETLGRRILRGRGFSGDQDDRSTATAPALINDRLARRLFGNDDPLQVGNRIGLHFLEHLAPMDLGRSLGDPEVEAYLLVQLPTDQVCEHFALA